MGSLVQRRVLVKFPGNYQIGYILWSEGPIGDDMGESLEAADADQPPSPKLTIQLPLTIWMHPDPDVIIDFEPGHITIRRADPRS